MKKIKIELNPLTIDEVQPNRIYNISEMSKILSLDHQTIKLRIKNGKLKPIPHRKYEHYKVFGSELRRFLKYSDDYEINYF